MASQLRDTAPSVEFYKANARGYDSFVPPFGHIAAYITTGELVSQIESNRTHTELRNWGFEGGIGEMTNEKFGYPVQIYNRVWTGVIAPIYLAASATLTEGQVIATPLVGHSVEGSDVHIRIEAYGNTERDTLDTITVALDKSTRESEGDYIRLHKAIAIPDQAQRVRLAFFYKDVAQPVDSVVVSRSNISTTIRSALEPLGQLRRGHFESLQDMILS